MDPCPDLGVAGPETCGVQHGTLAWCGLSSQGLKGDLIGEKTVGDSKE